MSRFFSRLLVAPAVAGFFLLPQRGSAQVNNGSSGQSSNGQEVEIPSSLLSDLEEYDTYIEQDSDLSSFQNESTREYITSNTSVVLSSSTIKVTRRVLKRIVTILLIPITLFYFLFWFLERILENLKVGPHKTLTPLPQQGLSKGEDWGRGSFQFFLSLTSQLPSYDSPTKQTFANSTNVHFSPFLLGFHQEAGHHVCFYIRHI